LESLFHKAVELLDMAELLEEVEVP